VVNGYARVAESTRNRVLAVVDEMGYRPNVAARNLRSGRSRVLALVVPEIDVPYFAELARAVIDIAGQHGYHVMIDQTDGLPERERQVLQGSVRAMPLDGLIFSPLTMSAAELRAQAQTRPVVLIGEHIFDGSFDHVAIDNVAAATEATAHLLSIGRTRLAAIGDQPYDTGETAQLRTVGFKRAHKLAGVDVDPDLIIPTKLFHRADGADAMEHLLSLDRPPDGVFCFNDLLALGAMKALAQADLSVPDDIAVVGFDDIEDGRYATPSLTTISPDKTFIATQAVERLIGHIEGDTPLRRHEVTAPHTLQVRGSTVSPRS
jgi:DNA-binding LacI/PurR family transcriptional regulator